MKVPHQKDCPECSNITPGHYRCGRCLTLMHLKTARERDQAYEEIKVLREALEFYANENNWYDVNRHEAGKPTIKMVIGSLDTSGTDWVGGHTARQALSPKEIK